MLGRFNFAAVGGFLKSRLRRMSIWSPAASIVVFVGMSLSATAQVPVITGINPSAVPVNGLGFTLTITGSGFQATSQVQINSTTRTPMVVSTQELKAPILASDIAAPGNINVKVLNFSGGMTFPSNTVQLTVVNAASPELISASPGFATQGVEQVSMTLVGANFRPGATVVISPPLATLSASTGQTQAGDVTVLSVTLVNSGVMTALISVSPTAVLGLRAVDVLNLDGTSTIDATQATPDGSTKSMRVSPADSIGSPLSVLNMAMMQPRDGTVVMQGDELNAQAILAGTGTGAVTGQWLWDGFVVEQFSATIVGGERTTIETRQSLPTWLLGTHTLQLRMLEPNQVASKPIEVVVNPGDWKMEQLIQPESGADFDVNEAPHLLWAIVPGAMKYQVGFSSQPYFSTIDRWFDVAENQWQVPADIWQSLPQGELYWTVRTVDASGEPRRPLPMRVLYRGQKGGSASPHPVAAAQMTGRYMGVDAKLILRGEDGQMIPIKADYLQGDYATPGAAMPSDGSAPATPLAKGATDAEAPKAKAAAPKKKVRPSEDGQLGMSSEWASGSNPPDYNVLSAAEHMKVQQGPWHFEINGSGLLNSILNPDVQRTSHGKVNNYVIQLSDQQKPWGANLRFGIVSPLLYTGAQYVTAATPRQGAELAIKTPAGAFSGFTNTDDSALGGGSGMNVQQQIEGASWQATLPPWAQLRAMWLNATENVTGGLSASGDVYGALLIIQFTKKKKWQWSTEYAASYDNADTASATSLREFGRAWRTGITGQPGKTKVSITYHDVSANFGNPTNPSLTPHRQPPARGVNASLAQTTKIAGTFGFNYAYLANNVQPITSDELLLNS
ncbi:MAG: IPT/TIG domain-containing protein, partial [Terracidiphilus sp.]